MLPLQRPGFGTAVPDTGLDLWSNIVATAVGLLLLVFSALDALKERRQHRIEARRDCHHVAGGTPAARNPSANPQVAAGPDAAASPLPGPNGPDACRPAESVRSSDHA